MAKTAPRIEIILDRSGSMVGVRKQTIDGFNRFVAEQEKNAAIHLTQFDDIGIDKTFDGIKAKDKPTLSFDNYEPRGATPLYDAIGRTVTALRDAKPTGKVVVLIITDGYENASTEWTREGVYTLITDVQKKTDWQFVFMGADIDAYGASSALGLRANQTYAYSGVNTGSTWGVASTGTMAYTSGVTRSMDTTDWTPDPMDTPIDPAGTFPPARLTFAHAVPDEEPERPSGAHIVW